MTSYATAALNAGIAMLSGSAAITTALGAVAPSSRIIKADGGGSPDGTTAIALDGTQFATATVPLWFIVDHKAFNREKISLAGYKYTGVFLLQVYQAIPANTEASDITDGARDFADTVLDQIIAQEGTPGCFAYLSRAELTDVGIVDEVSDLGAPGSNPGYTVAEYELEWMAFGAVGSPTYQPPAGALMWLQNGTAVVSGDTVNWPDSSGNSNNATGTGALSIITVGGKPAVAGFGESDALTAALNYIAANGWHIYIICSINSYFSGGNCLFSADGNSNPSVLGMAIHVGDPGNSDAATNNVGVYGTGGTSVASGAVPLDTVVLVDASLNAGATTITCKVSGSAENTAPYPYGSSASTDYGTRIGGSAFTPSDYADANVLEILVYPPSVDPALVRTYAQNAFGVAA